MYLDRNKKPHYEREVIMTNLAIIEMNKMMLFADGVLKANEEGEIQEIHTYQAWKKLGFQVKKGEKAIAKFAVWTFNAKKKKDEEEPAETDDSTETKKRGRMYMKMSAFFTDEQVERIQKK